MRDIKILMIAACLLSQGTLEACSAVTIAMGGRVLLGQNNDNSFSRNMLLHVTPNRDGFFGRICVSMETPWA
jgi:hypothetical protein